MKKFHFQLWIWTKRLRLEFKISRCGKRKIKFEDGKEFIVQNNETAIDEIAMILIDNALKYNVSKEPIEAKIFRQKIDKLFYLSQIFRMKFRKMN